MKIIVTIVLLCAGYLGWLIKPNDLTGYVPNPCSRCPNTWFDSSNLSHLGVCRGGGPKKPKNKEGYACVEKWEFDFNCKPVQKYSEDCFKEG